jgi:hypothetical protein
MAGYECRWGVRACHGASLPLTISLSPIHPTSPLPTVLLSAVFHALFSPSLSTCLILACFCPHPNDPSPFAPPPLPTPLADLSRPPLPPTPLRPPPLHGPPSRSVPLLRAWSRRSCWPWGRPRAPTSPAAPSIRSLAPTSQAD